MCRKSCIFMSFVLLFSLAGSATASVWWVGGGGDTYWNNASNWGPDDGDGYGFYVADVASSTILVDSTHSATAGSGARIGYSNGIGGNPVTVNITGGSLTSAQTRLAYKSGGASVINVSGTGQFLNGTYIRSSYSHANTNSAISIIGNGYMSVGTYWRHAEKGQGHITIKDNGLLEVATYLDLADSSGDGYLNIHDSGKLVVGGRFDVGAKVGTASGTTTVNLYDGTIQAGSLAMTVPGGYAGEIDIELGELLLQGDLRSDATLLGYISSGYIIGYGGTGSVVVGASLVDVGGTDYTSITACSVPEPIDVLVDIKPESCPNPMPVKGEGVLKAAILGSCTLDVQDIDAASITLGGAPAIRSKIQDVGGPAAVVLDDMDDIAARPWTDLRDPGEGTGLLYWAPGELTMGIDYGVTNDSAGVPHPLSGWDYQGNFVGVGAPGGAWGDPAICNYWWTDWCNSYYGKFDREISGPFTFAELGILSTDDTILLDVFKTIANSPEHVREIQLYDSLGNRNTYSVQAEATAVNVGAGWKTYAVCLSNALENNADLTDITKITLWVSSWSFAPNYPGAPWPEYTGGRPTGTPVLIDDLRLVRAHDPECGDCLTGADGFDDLVLKFNKADIVAGLGAVHHGDDVDLDLTGNLVSSCPIVGSDCVQIVGKADPAQRPPKK